MGKASGRAEGRAALLGILHNYIDANRLRTIGTRRLLEGGEAIWFTETGGIVSRTNRRKVTFPESPRHAATATRFLFDDLIPSAAGSRASTSTSGTGPGAQDLGLRPDRPDGQAAAGHRVLQRLMPQTSPRASAAQFGAP